MRKRTSTWAREVLDGLIGGTLFGVFFALQLLLVYWLTPAYAERRIGLTKWPASLSAIGSCAAAGLVYGLLGRFASEESHQRLVAGLALAAASLPMGFVFRGTAGVVVFMAVIFGLVGAVGFRATLFGELPRPKDDGSHRGTV